MNRGEFSRVQLVGAKEIHTRGKYWATQNERRVSESMEVKAMDTKMESGISRGQGDRKNGVATQLKSFHTH